MEELKSSDQAPEAIPGQADPNPAIEPVASDAPEPVDYVQIATQIAQLLRQVVASGDELAGIVVNPENIAGFTEAFRALPDEIVPAQVREALPIEADPNCEGLQVVTRSQIEAQFLQKYFGPEQGGGTGALPRLQRALEAGNSPVKITVEFLRHLYLSEQLALVQPRIVRPHESALMLNGRRP